MRERPPSPFPGPPGVGDDLIVAPGFVGEHTSKSGTKQNLDKIQISPWARGGPPPPPPAPPGAFWQTAPACDRRAGGWVAGAEKERPRHPGECTKGLVRRERGGVVKRGVRRAGHAHGEGCAATHPARGVVGALRDPGRRQPPSRDLSRVRPDGRCRLRRRRGAVPDGWGRRGFEIDEAEVIYWGRCSDCRAPTTPRKRRNRRVRE